MIYIENRNVHHLSDRLIKFNDPPQPDEHPAYVWHQSQRNIVPLGHSGSPVFLQNLNGTTFHLLGTLITDKSASPLKFSLRMVRADIAIDHINEILANHQPYLYPNESDSQQSVDAVQPEQP